MSINVKSIMKAYLTTILILLSTSLVAQDNNIFLNRDFWKSKPSVKEIKQKIKEGHDPSASGPHGFDGVSYGIIDNAPLASIKYMLKQEGNPVDKLSHGGLAYLPWAAYKGNLELMEHLIELGADPHAKNTGGTNMFLMAALGGVEDQKVYDLILKNGVDINYRNSNGANALLLLASSNANNTSTFEYLLSKGISLESEDEDGNGLINYASRGGNLPIMKMGVAKGLNYDKINSKGENALFYASYGRKRSKVQLETFQYLESLGLEADMVNWEGKTPLHNAIRRGNINVIDYFLERGVNINQIDEHGNTALMNAIGGDIENIEKIIPLVSSVNHKNHEGHSALTMAIKVGSKEAFDLLLKSGADLKHTDVKGNNLLHYAFRDFRSSKKEVYSHIISTLHQNQVKSSLVDEEGNTLAHMAVEKNSLFLLKQAIALGADINHKNKDGLSSLHLAAMQASDNQLITELMESGANKNILTQFEESAFDLANQNEQLTSNNVDINVLKITEK